MSKKVKMFGSFSSFFSSSSSSSLLISSISSIGVIAILYKVVDYYRTKSLVGTYFKDKTILVTGASLGLGKAIAEELYKAGGQVILCARNQEELNKVKNSLMKSKPGKEPEVLCLDVSSKYDVVKLRIDQLIEKFKRIDVLVNNAGVSFRGESFNTKDEVFQKIMDVNFFGPVRLTNIILQHMFDDNLNCDKAKVKRRDYSIVNVGSVQSYLAIPHRAAYGASKHALLAYSDSLRAELFQHHNIEVINTQPGYINTNVSINALTNDGQKNNSNDDDHRNGFAPNYVAQRILESIVRKDREVLITIVLHRVAIWLRFFFPRVYYWAMFKRARQSYDRKFQ